MGELMEIAFLIGGILIGVIGALTVRNTLKLARQGDCIGTERRTEAAGRAVSGNA
jgi:hypothetical protein